MDDARFRACLGVFLVGLLGVSTLVVAQQPLPKVMTGTWDVDLPPATRMTVLASGSWSIVIERQNPDGSIEGKMTWAGGRHCEAVDEPITGSFDGNELRIEGMLRDKYRNAGCRKAIFVLKRNAFGNAFAGELVNSPMKVRLNP